MYYQLLITTPWLFQYLLSTKMMMKSNVHVFIYGTGETEILFEQKEHKKKLGDGDREMHKVLDGSMQS